MGLGEKEGTESGSPVETESPPPVSSGGEGPVVVVVPEVLNMAVSMSMEKSLGVPAAATVEGRGGGVAGGGGAVGSGVMSSGSGDLRMISGSTEGKKKRGRPRKYDSEGNLRVPYKTTATPPSGFTLSSPTSPQYSSSSKRGRGRPLGSGIWQHLASLGELFANTAGGDFTAHVVNVQTGEDVTGKILSFAQKGPRGICVLSANGPISNVTIRQPGSSGGILTYEGRFEILTLTGSYTISETGGMRSRTGGLSVSLAGPDGRVIGGGVAGLLLAASPIQIVVGSFMPNGYKAHKRKHHTEPRISTATATHGAMEAVTAAKPVSQAPPGSNIFPTQISHVPVETNGEADNSTSNTDNPNSTSTDIADWNGSDPAPDQRSTPDINVSVAFEQQFTD